jgi:protein XagA
MRFALTCLFLCFCLSADRPAVAGAWVYPEGRGQVILTTLLAGARMAYGPDGRLVATPPYRKLEARAYLEHGLTDWLTLVGEGSAMRFSGAASQSYDPVEALIAEAKAGLPLSAPPPTAVKYQGLGLGAVGARLRLLDDGGFVVSTQASLRTASQEARRFLDMREALQVDARLLIGRKFELAGFTGFVDTQLGTRSGGQNGNEFRLDLTAGLRPFDRLLIMGQSFSAFAPHGARKSSITEQKFQLSAVFEATPSISLQIGGVVALGGVNAPAEQGIVSAIWWRY